MTPTPTTREKLKRQILGKLPCELNGIRFSDEELDAYANGFLSLINQEKAEAVGETAERAKWVIETSEEVWNCEISQERYISIEDAVDALENEFPSLTNKKENV